MQIIWIAPYDGSSPITNYIITILNADGVTYSTELSNCNGSVSSIVTGTNCIIPIHVLRSAPFFLDWGTSVFAKVIASNIVSNSLTSPAGNGAIILTVPDAPINLANVISQTLGEQIGLSWSAGISSGGSPIIDYRISSD